jgi:hypothetical protein
LFLQSSDAGSPDEHLELYHNGTDGVLSVGAGTISLSDKALQDSAVWSLTSIPLSGTDADWDDVAVASAGGADHSLCYYLEEALSGSGGTLDAAYDHGGAGSGRTIYATDGAVEIQNDDEGVNLYILRATEDTGHNDLIQITNPDTDALGILFGGAAGDVEGYVGDRYGHRIWTEGEAITIGRQEPSASSYRAESYFMARYEFTNPDSYGSRAEMIARDVANTSVANLHVKVVDVDTTPSSAIQGDADTIRFDADSSLILWGTDDVDIQTDAFTCGADVSAEIDAPYLDLLSTVVKKDYHTATYASGTVTADFSNTGGSYNRVAITGNVTSFSITPPTTDTDKIVDSLYLEVFASGGSYTIEGFSGFTWIGDFDPDTVAYTIPAGEIAFIVMVFTGSLGYGGYRAQLIPMP